jgi:tRNA pseudouridine38-40 synthase
VKKFRAVFSYRGAGFNGAAEQSEAGTRTVVGELRNVIETVAQSRMDLIIAGRTDAGVHAREQVMSFTFPETPDIDFDCYRAKHACNSRLNPEIAVTSLEEVDENFDARRSAKSRTYHYVIDNGEVPDVFLFDTTWHIWRPLDVDAMNRAAKYFLGEQDFTSVCRDSGKRNVRKVTHAEFFTDGRVITFEITANAFCWQMVRSIVGILVMVGQGKLEADSIPVLLEKHERAYGSHMAPARGLTLWSIEY